MEIFLKDIISLPSYYNLTFPLSNIMYTYNQFLGFLKLVSFNIWTVVVTYAIVSAFFGSDLNSLFCLLDQLAK